MLKGSVKILKIETKPQMTCFSKAVSRVRQPIESLFNWLIQKTDIQRASKVRSAKGRLIHIFGKIASAFINLIF